MFLKNYLHMRVYRYYFGIFSLIAILTQSLSSCSKQTDLYDEAAVAQVNAVKLLGPIDERHDWSTIAQGSVTINANADLDDIVKVQILSESPFFNDDAKVLNEANVKKGGKATLVYDAPKNCTKLVAACVSSKGAYYIQVFKPGTQEVSFAHGAKSRVTRASGSEAPHITSITLSAPHKTFNAMRAEAGETCVIKGKTYTEWSDGTWAGEQAWQPADGTTFDGGWKMDTEKNRGIIFRDIDGFAEGELENIQAITEAFLYKYSNDQYSVNGKKNNLRLIRNSAYFTLNNNYLITNGVNPVTLIPVQIYTTEFKQNHVYYYYYKPESIPAGMDEVDYIKQLPKYKAIQVERATTTPASNAGTFIRNKEFLLPYYGDGVPTQGANTASAIFPKGYRIGFLNMKHTENNWDISNCLHGCTYGDGRLNYAVNHIQGHYFTAMDKSIGGSTEEGMQFDDPRIAIFSANGKTYMCFEDGADCNFSDMIIEVGSGTDIVNEELDPEGASYTMCFEDEPLTADYDVNDVVLEAVRLNENTVRLSIVACGANDALWIQGIEGHVLASKEIHEFFNVKPGEAFINTQKDKKWYQPVSEDITIDKTMSIENFLRGITVRNVSTGKILSMPQKGAPPFTIIVPYGFQWPLEGYRITSAYPNFLKWSQNMNQATDWYLQRVDNNVYSKPQ